jgi:hypothetical protein
MLVPPQHVAFFSLQYMGPFSLTLSSRTSTATTTTKSTTSTSTTSTSTTATTATRVSSFREQKGPSRTLIESKSQRVISRLIKYQVPYRK